MAAVTVLPCLLCRKELKPIPADHEEHLAEEHKVKFHMGWIVRKTLKERRKTSENASDNDRDQSKEGLEETDTEMEEDDIDEIYSLSELQEQPAQNEKVGNDENSTNKEEKLLKEETDVNDIEILKTNADEKESIGSPTAKNDKCCTHCSKLIKEETDVKDIEMVAIDKANKEHIDFPTNNYKCCTHYCEEIYEKPFILNTKLNAENVSHVCSWEDWCNDRLPIQRGVKKQTEIIKFVCTWPGCEKLSTKKDEMKQHLRIHQNTYSRKDGLKLAQAKVGTRGITVVPAAAAVNQAKLKQTIDIVYKCDNCPKQFSRQDTLKKHKIGCNEVLSSSFNKVKLNQTIANVYKCDNCPKQFSRQDTLKKHKIGCSEIEIIHMEEKKHKCVKCGKQFSKEDQFKKHITGCFEKIVVVPTTTRPIKKIKVEEKKATKKIQMQEKKPKIEKCMNCKKEFSKQDDLKKHEIECLEIDPSNVRQSGRRRSVKPVNYCEDED